MISLIVGLLERQSATYTCHTLHRTRAGKYLGLICVDRSPTLRLLRKLWMTGYLLVKNGLVAGNLVFKAHNVHMDAVGFEARTAYPTSADPWAFLVPHAANWVVVVPCQHWTAAVPVTRGTTAGHLAAFDGAATATAHMGLTRFIPTCSRVRRGVMVRCGAVRAKSSGRHRAMPSGVDFCRRNAERSCFTFVQVACVLSLFGESFCESS